MTHSLRKAGLDALLQVETSTLIWLPLVVAHDQQNVANSSNKWGMSSITIKHAASVEHENRIGALITLQQIS